MAHFATNLCDLGHTSLGLSFSWGVIFSKSHSISVILSINSLNFQLFIVDLTYFFIPWGNISFELFLILLGSTKHY